MNKAPTFSNETLNEIVAAFTRRSKAIKHKGCKIEFTKEDDGFERLNIDCDLLDSPPVQIRTSVWADGVLYFRTCQASKAGWDFNVQFYGKVSNIIADKVVSNFENSLHLREEKELLSQWKDISPYIK